MLSVLGAELRFSPSCTNVCVFQGVAEESPVMDLEKVTDLLKVTFHIKGWIPLL